MTESEISGSGTDRRRLMKGAAVTAAATGAGALAPGAVESSLTPEEAMPGAGEPDGVERSG
ncbi:twin-arginine translocation signal domain-containing protein [Solihabitans fulvus]|uniref:Twin-arginine translocation signal domain-containing protein n=1 Tax=Solihabitans fulvus TaxID=1892852 RepID=A0A5B2WTV0_9PSEU|nr:twin-arginine translocation signal domain-containing protein [Solihabitans fulvus]KAA2253859.1 twin-arginine translocation signal domain-containing protein [Solihabitans fulvus]